ncbi:DUF5992 family protein [Microbulbifer sp. VTAC004]|uniref:DUF5992 family protein n=1 Tax=unclassified Microbulbifer TaxID=2619833 RepID=UPI004039B28D
MKKFLIPLIAVSAAFSTPSFAEGRWLATSVNVVAITNTAANGKSFNVTVANGDGNYACEDTTISFPLSVAGNNGNDENIHNRAFSMAMVAFTTGKKVNIYTYEDVETCSHAAYIAFSPI